MARVFLKKIKNHTYCRYLWLRHTLFPKLSEVYLTLGRDVLVFADFLNRLDGIIRVCARVVRSIRIVPVKRRQPDVYTPRLKGNFFRRYINLQILDIGDDVNLESMKFIGTISSLEQLTRLRIQIGSLEGVETCHWEKLKSYAIIVSSLITSFQGPIL